MHNDEVLKKFLNHLRGILHTSREENVLKKAIDAFGKIIEYAKEKILNIVEEQVNYLNCKLISINE